MKNPKEKTDLELKTEVLEELKSEPHVRVTDIGVLVKNGTITLNGSVGSYDEKWSAMESAKRVEGASEIADDIEVQLPDVPHCTDSDIAAAAARKIEGLSALMPGTVRLMVSNGWVTLEGEVQWLHQKKTAEECVRALAGVRGISNVISIRPVPTVEEVEAAIVKEFAQTPSLSGEMIQVETLGSLLILRGQVRKTASRVEAERIAKRASGIFSVDNQITVRVR